MAITILYSGLALTFFTLRCFHTWVGWHLQFKDDSALQFNKLYVQILVTKFFIFQKTVERNPGNIFFLIFLLLTTVGWWLSVYQLDRGDPNFLKYSAQYCYDGSMSGCLLKIVAVGVWFTIVHSCIYNFTLGFHLILDFGLHLYTYTYT